MTIKPERVETLVQEAVDLHAPLAQEAGVTLEAKMPRHELSMAAIASASSSFWAT